MFWFFWDQRAADLPVVFFCVRNSGDAQDILRTMKELSSLLAPVSHIHVPPIQFNIYIHMKNRPYYFTLLWFDLSKPFKICLLAKWLSICLNLLKHSIIFCYCTTTPFNTLWKDLKGRKIGLWYMYVCLFRELFHLSKPFIGPFCQTVF